MKKYMFFTLLFASSILFSACTTKVDRSIESSNQEDISNLLAQLAQKEKEINDIIKELEQCNINKKIEK